MREQARGPAGGCRARGESPATLGLVRARVLLPAVGLAARPYSRAITLDAPRCSLVALHVSADATRRALSAVSRIIGLVPHLDRNSDFSGFRPPIKRWSYACDDFRVEI